MDIFPFEISTILNNNTLVMVLKALIIVIAGFVLLKIITFTTGRAVKKRLTPHSAMLVKKAIFYTGAFIIFVTVLRQLGFKLTALLGAAGIVGIAVGFASQTSISNIISGIFLIAEKPFAVDDVIKVGDTTGIVISIDLLSIKIKTFDNMFIRIPNETLIKTQVTNVTRFPVRRLDIDISIAYKEDLGRVKDLLLEIAKNNPYCLDNPEPLYVIKEFGTNGVELLLGLWFAKTDYLQLKNSIMESIKNRFDEEGIEIPFPHVSLHPGAATNPFPVQLVEGLHKKVDYTVYGKK